RRGSGRRPAARRGGRRTGARGRGSAGRAWRGSLIRARAPRSSRRKRGCRTPAPSGPPAASAVAGRPPVWEARPVDLIEKLTGLSPDGGNGMLEAVYYLVFAFAVFTVWRVRSHR